MGTQGERKAAAQYSQEEKLREAFLAGIAWYKDFQQQNIKRKKRLPVGNFNRISHKVASANKKLKLNLI